ncbi:MAG: GNAT family N-acetyltransferase [Acidimicrobiales bacterium]
MAPGLIDEAWRRADEAAAAGGITIRTLDSINAIAALDAVFAQVWGSRGHAFVPIELTQAMRYAGNYVVGAFAGERMIGGSVGFFGEHEGRRHLHSHITGVLPDLQARALGYAIKVHQRAWALEAGLDEVVWTYDPLIRRNAYFNLSKLGAEVVGYEPNFYGDALGDDINAGDESDRAVVRWPIASAGVAARLADPGGSERRLGGRADAAVILDDGPTPRKVGDDPGRPLCAWVPPDIVAIRRSDPALALAWRRALRATLGAAVAEGYVAVDMSRDGWYRLERPTA